MFTIRMYNFNKKINSTKKPNITGTPFSCEMKSSSSILFPVVEIRSSNNNKTIPLFNYAYIQDFNRYYWIDDVTYDLGKWIITMHCDVLASFQYDILNSTQYVIRSSSESDDTIADTLYLTKEASYNTEFVQIDYAGVGGDPDDVHAKNPNNTYTAEQYFNVGITSGYFVVGIVGNNTAGVTFYSFSNNNFKSFINNALSFTPSNMNDVSSGVANAIFDPIQYITSVKWFPIEPYSSTSVTSIKLGGYTITGTYTAYVLTATDIKTVMMRIGLPKHPSNKKYMNLSPFTELNLVFQPFGVIPLDTTKLLNSTELAINIAIDFCGGMCNLYVYREDTHETIPFSPDGLLYSVATDYGVTIPVSSLVMDWKAGAVVSAMQFLKTVIPSSDTAKTNNGILSSIASTMLPERADQEKAINFLDKAMDLTASALGQVSSTGAVGSFLAYMSNRPYVMGWFKNLTEEDNDRFGRPLYRKRMLALLSGFCVCMNAIVPFVSGSPMEEEVKTIQSLLNNGVYLE